LCLRPSDVDKLGDQQHHRDPHRLLPVYRTIWRDRIGFIPAYAIAFCASLWMTLSLLNCWPFRECHGQPILGLLSRCSSCWRPAVLIVLIGVLADYLEDFIHVRYLTENKPSPGGVLVRVSWLISKIKLGACIVGIAGLAAAVVLLARLQVIHVITYIRTYFDDKNLTHDLPAAPFSIPALVGVLLAIAAAGLAFSTIVAFFRREPKIGTGHIALTPPVNPPPEQS